MAKKTKNKKLKKQIRDAFILTIIISSIIFVLYEVISLMTSPAKTFILGESTISQEESKVGYVIRDEIIIENSKENKKIEPIINEGEKVAVGSPVFKYYNVNEEEITTQISDLNNEIQEALLGHTDLLPSDVKALESRIENQIEKLRNENNMQEILEYKNNISNDIIKKAKIAGSLSSAGVYINDLISKRNDLEKKLNDGAEYVYSQRSGTVSYRIDGLEKELSIDNFENITTEYLRSLDLTTGQIISKKENKAKVINNFECYIAVALNSEEAKKAKEGNKLGLRLSNQEVVDAEIYKIKNEGNQKIIFFKITEGVEQLINYRKVSIDVIWWQYTGLIIPKSSILYENGKSYIFIKKNAGYNKTLVEVKKENANNCLIDNYDTEELIEFGYTTDEINKMKTVKLYDEVLVDPAVV